MALKYGCQIFHLYALMALKYGCQIFHSIKIQSDANSEARKNGVEAQKASEDSKIVAERQANHFIEQSQKEGFTRMLSDLDNRLHQLTHEKVTMQINGKGLQEKLEDFFGKNYKEHLWDRIPEREESRQYYRVITPFINLATDLITYLERFCELFNIRLMDHSVESSLVQYYLEKYQQLIDRLYQKQYATNALFELYRGMSLKFKEGKK